jgi:exopolysaccharide biosynthesis protein
MFEKPSFYLSLNRNQIANIKLLLGCIPILSILLYLTVQMNTVNAQTPTPIKPLPPSNPTLPTSPPPTAVANASAYGNQISLNGRTVPGAWFQQRSKNQVTTHIADGTLRQLIGIDLLDSNNPTQQPIQWFSSETKLQMTARLAGGYRYLDITNLVKTSGWQIQAQGNVLTVSTPQVKVTNIRESNLVAPEVPKITNTSPNPTVPRKLVTIDFDKPTPWQIRQESQPTASVNGEWTIILDGIADPALVQRYTPIVPIPTLTEPQQPNLLKQLPIPTPVTPEPTVKRVEIVNNQTLIRISVPLGFAPRIYSSPNYKTLAAPGILPVPNLSVLIVPDALLPRNIAWAPGLRWRQQWLNLAQDSFPVVWLEMNPRTVSIKPIVSNSDTLIGTAPLIQTTQKYGAIAGINGGYFNRNNRYPLGAIRRDGQWLSSPILNRGAIAWNNSGEFYVGRLALQETLTTSTNQRLPILFINSGYVQSGIARYTPAWGSTYTPLTDKEIIITVQKNQIVNQVTALKAGETQFPIPTNGYILTLRSNASSNLNLLPTGSTVTIQNSTIPSDFNRYSNIIGAGPLLIQNRQIVLDAKAEKFSDAFINERAIRSGICTNAAGNVLIASVHNRAGGAGPTLAEHAQLMQQLGCVNALNLDGGSSTSLYLGGQLIDRSPSTAARVHNGIGIFRK